MLKPDIQYGNTRLGVPIAIGMPGSAPSFADVTLAGSLPALSGSGNVTEAVYHFTDLPIAIGKGNVRLRYNTNPDCEEKMLLLNVRPSRASGTAPFGTTPRYRRLYRVVKALKEIMLATFEKAAKESSNVTKYQFWRHINRPMELWSNKVIEEKVRYVHQNPVKAGLVYREEDYAYSSAADYAGGQGLLKEILVAR